jgi:hypothetical protein
MSSNKHPVFACFLILLIFLPSSIAMALDEIPSSLADVQIIGAPGDEIGPILATGDINCDNEPDLFFGAPGFSFESGDDKGGSTLIYGIYGPIESDAGIIDLGATRPNVEIISSITAGTLGFSLTLADLNNDGCDDLLVGDPQAWPQRWPFAGRVNVLFGRADAPPGWIVNWMLTLPDLSFIYDWLFLNLGETIGTGDFNGDGNLDVFISGVPLPQAGAVYVAFGPFERTSGAFRNFSSDPPDLQIVAHGEQGPWYNSIYQITDLNGDGLSDLFIGAPTNRNLFSHGSAYVFFGRPTATLPDVWDMQETPADITIRTTDASSYRAFGHQVQLADLNGGGKDDLLIADPGYTVDFWRKGALTFFDHHRLSSGTEIDLSEEIPDVTVIGRGTSWWFFDKLAVARGQGGQSLFATSPYFTHDDLWLSGAVFRLDQDLFTNSGTYVQLDYVEPTTIYYGDTENARFGEGVLVVDLDGNESLDLVVGGRGTIPDRGAIHIFYDQFDTTLPPDDDDDDDDDDQDDDSAAAELVKDIDTNKKIIPLPDEEGGCRCGW